MNSSVLQICSILSGVVPISATAQEATYIYINDKAGKLQLALNGRVIPAKEHEAALTRAYVESGGRGANATLLVGSSTPLKVFWGFMGLLTGIGYNVRIYAVDESTPHDDCDKFRFTEGANSVQ